MLPAAVFILTESLAKALPLSLVMVALILGLDITLVVKLGIDDLELLINLTVGIRACLDKLSWDRHPVRQEIYPLSWMLF